MVLSFDLRDFLSNCKASKPPYRCPIETCGKTYRSFAGIQMHVSSHSDCRDSSSDARRPVFSNKCNPMFYDDDSSDQGTTLLGTRENLTYAEAQRMIEVEIEGRIHRININEPMGIVCLDSHQEQAMQQSNGIISNGNGLIEEINGDSQDNLLNQSLHRRSAKKGKHKRRDIAPVKGVPTGQNLQSIVTEPAPTQIKLPEPSYRVLNGKEVVRAPPRPLAYFRYIDKSPEELDEQIEYDMDEEDFSWLELINKKRAKDNLCQIPPDTFELLMDRLEKECYFLNEKNGHGDYYSNQAIDEDAVCCICNDGECQNSNAILFCDMCDLPVHQECYGVPYIPEGQWLCRRCLQSPSRSVDCILCPNRGGAFKQTDDGRWCHVVCALWVPEVCFANTVFLEPIDSIDAIPSARWKLICYICKQKNTGACIQCHKSNCYTAFHVTCAQQAGLHMRMEAVREFHGSTVNTYIRKEAYCDAHMPVDRPAGRTLNNNAETDEESDDDVEDEDDSSDEEGKTKDNKNRERKRLHSGLKENNSFDNANLTQKKEIKAKMKKARKILAEKRSACPTVSIPTIPAERLTEIAQLINIPKRNQFLQRLLGYWTLKRESRNGVPLLRRLQISNGGGSGRRATRLGADVEEPANDEQSLQLRAELKELQRLRQDLERARILIELIRKREKVKREMIRNLEQRVKFQIEPFKIFLQSVLNLLKAKDTNGFFLEPVDINEVTDYLYFIKRPMSFAEMQSKVNRHEYISFDEFEADLDQIVENCTTYNEKTTVYYKAAIKLRDQCKVILKQAREKMESIGFDEKSGIHTNGYGLKQLLQQDNDSFRFIDQGSNQNLRTNHYSLDQNSSASPIVSLKNNLKNELTNLRSELKSVEKNKSGGRKTLRLRSIRSKIEQVESELSEIEPNSCSNQGEASRRELRVRSSSIEVEDLVTKQMDNGVSTSEMTSMTTKEECLFVPTNSESSKKSNARAKLASPLKMILNKKADSPLLTLLTSKQKKTLSNNSRTRKSGSKSSTGKSRPVKTASLEPNIKQITSYFQVLSNNSDSFKVYRTTEKSESEEEDMNSIHASIHSSSSSSSSSEYESATEESEVHNSSTESNRRKKKIKKSQK